MHAGFHYTVLLSHKEEILYFAQNYKIKGEKLTVILKSQAKQELFNDNVHDRETETAFQKWYFNATFQKSKYCVRHKI